ncbi:hypothetical protein, partial [Undibacterium luofuense]|uniref:hypothetical protein n=1 Tax=Undibacterium luofuense TaxID=2828733 RepID=UPI0030EE4456
GILIFNPTALSASVGGELAPSSSYNVWTYNQKKLYNAISGGGDMTQVDLVKLQWNISRWSVGATVFGNCMKEFTDSVKQGANRLS